MKYIIGIIPRFEKDNFTTKVFYKISYIEALNEYKFDIIFLPYIQQLLENQINKCDGFLIPGGNDIDPSLYNQSMHSKTILCNPMESLIEKTVIDHSIKHKKPILGICKGMQSLNVFLGGSLKQDISNHQSCYHQITYKKEKDFVNSFHHQCIDVLADSFKITHFSDDGVIEGIEHTIYPFIGVQWHPELDLSSSINRRIFDKFKTLLDETSVIK